jgi:uncharacterized protein (DUF1499 family)
MKDKNKKKLPIIDVGILLFLCVFCTGCFTKTPKNIGLTENGLNKCPEKPNCIVSMGQGENHTVLPIKYETSRPAAVNLLQSIVSSMPGAEIVTATDNYLYAEFRSRILKFVDDVEFFFPLEESVIHYRSASRLGYYDFGVNVKRMEYIRSRFKAESKGP